MFGDILFGYTAAGTLDHCYFSGKKSTTYQDTGTLPPFSTCPGRSPTVSPVSLGGLPSFHLSSAKSVPFHLHSLL